MRPGGRHVVPVDRWVLDRRDRALTARRSAPARLALALWLTFYRRHRRFPRDRTELSGTMVAALAAQTGTSVEDLDRFDWSGATASRLRRQIRASLGFRVCTVADAAALTQWLATEICPRDRASDRVHQALVERLREQRIECPSPGRMDRMVRSALHRSENALLRTVADRLSPAVVERMRQLVGTKSWAALRAEPVPDGSGESRRTRTIRLPRDLFAGVPPELLAAWRDRAAVESPSHLWRDHPDHVRWALVAAFLHCRQREITGSLADGSIDTTGPAGGVRPASPHAFCAALRQEMSAELSTLDNVLPSLDWLVVDRGRLLLTEPGRGPHDHHRGQLERALRQRWGDASVLDALIETMLRTDLLASFVPLGGRCHLPPLALAERLLRVIYARGANLRLRDLAGPSPTEDELRYVRRRYLTVAACRRAAGVIADATLSLWEPERRHGAVISGTTGHDHGPKVYWTLDGTGTAVLNHTVVTGPASEVSAMIDGSVRHGTRLAVGTHYCDTHSQSYLGFGLSRLLGFELLPRIRPISHRRLSLPCPEHADRFRRLRELLAGPIDWDLIEHNYRELARYTTALRHGGVPVSAVLGRLVRHGGAAYLAAREVGRAQRTIFLARYLRDRDLQQDVEAALDLLARQCATSEQIFPGPAPEPRRRELSLACQRILVGSLGYVTALMARGLPASVRRPGRAGGLSPVPMVPASPCPRRPTLILSRRLDPDL